jgi:hypothetical protein
MEGEQMHLAFGGVSLTVKVNLFYKCHWDARTILEVDSRLGA